MPNNKDREKKEFNKPNNGDNFKAFFDVLSDKNGDDMLVDAAMKTYSDELSSLEKQGRDVLEVVGDGAKKLFSKKKAVAPDYLNETNTAPVLTNEAVEHQIKRNQNNTKIKLLNLIEELCNNDKFYKLIDDDIPCLKSILDYIDEHNNNETILNDVIKFIEKWLDECSIIITKNEDCFSLLNEQFKIYYETNLTD